MPYNLKFISIKERRRRSPTFTSMAMTTAYGVQRATKMRNMTKSMRHDFTVSDQTFFILLGSSVLIWYRLNLVLWTHGIKTRQAEI